MAAAGGRLRGTARTTEEVRKQEGVCPPLWGRKEALLSPRTTWEEHASGKGEPGRVE